MDDTFILPGTGNMIHDKGLYACLACELLDMKVMLLDISRSLFPCYITNILHQILACDFSIMSIVTTLETELISKHIKYQLPAYHCC